MIDKSMKIILSGIFICLVAIAVIIAVKPVNIICNFPEQPVQKIELNDNEKVIQLASDRIAIYDDEKVLVFDFDSKEQIFRYIGKFDYSEYFKGDKYFVPEEPVGGE